MRTDGDVIYPAEESLNALRLPDGAEVDVLVRRSKRARWILLQVGNLDGAVELVLPEEADLAEGWEFAESRVGWVQKRLGRVIAPVPFADGNRVPLLGEPLRIRRLDDGPGRIQRVGPDLLVGAAPDRLAMRVQRWMRAQAVREIRWRVEDKAARLGRRRGRVTIRDQQTRWGSCSDTGNLNFSWRLVMAPPPVLDLVVAHEVAHLAEMNHGPRFWAHVARLCDDVDGPRKWLRRNAMELHRYGR